MNKISVFFAFVLCALMSPILMASNIEPFLDDVRCFVGEPSSEYPEGSDWAEKSALSTIVVDPLGNILKKKSYFPFDENDRLRVLVFGNSELLKLLRLERESSYGDSNELRVLGGVLILIHQLNR